MWAEEVNAAGGLYVEEYGKRIPVEIIRYDDTSDPGTGVKLLEKLILEDKVDFVLSPDGSDMHFAMAPVANKYGYPLIGPTCGVEKLREVAATMPYYFNILNMPREQGAALVEILADLGVKKVALVYISELFGIEWTAAVTPALGIADIEIALLKSYPVEPKDLSPVLKEAKAANVDAFLAMSYAADSFLLTGQSMELEFNPKAFFGAVVIAAPAYRDAFGANVVEGVMGAGVWNPKLSPEAQEYFDRFVQRWEFEPDRWGAAYAYSAAQVLGQAIEISGTLDRTAVRDVLATETFDTVLGPVKFENQQNIFSPGEIGQWQNGEFLAIDVGEKRQAEPIYPKPSWP